MNETDKKRLLMRSNRRGTKEMDLILGAFARARLETMSRQEITQYEALLNENDQDLYRWVNGHPGVPPALVGLLGQISEFAQKGVQND